MAGPTDHTTLEGQILDRHEIELQNKQLRAEMAFVMLNQYNWNTVGSMPNVSWTAPTGRVFEFNPGYGELYYNNIPYSGLGPDKKREFFRYLPKFIFECLKAYDDNYGL